ncbi:MAG: hypothetical protein KF832_30385 [Caldilineaceae bacterium]|nr:hypothetical protein [Caldilineaceae bacterium]
MHTLVQRVAASGRLRLHVALATQMVHAACCGVVLTLLSQPVAARDLTLSAVTREAILAAMLVAKDANTTTVIAPQNNAVSQIANRAVALKAVLPEVTNLTPSESGLLGEWLDRLSYPSS